MNDKKVSLALLMKVGNALNSAKKSLYTSDTETWRQVTEAEISLRHALNLIDVKVDMAKPAHLRAAEAVNAELMGVEA